ncbi:uncharacterized protein SOCG_04633 [Schizosaccharomyces octosporus yFS286]|uniref:Uncharacterized protein n=1 Tax=Schizosaccharomyces octosporus (strain yFS286) TaxID=483514 RepID=S9Q272_SCHOY|nr:uncharacterized protein SOCG_04633 [Schizosaccharomyces octosporus yFS286]EPX75391.1 hypothetical protein SOCG_04633 [Schizosaccharomyces octosporus yFS286]
MPTPKIGNASYNPLSISGSNDRFASRDLTSNTIVFCNTSVRNSVSAFLHKECYSLATSGNASFIFSSTNTTSSVPTIIFEPHRNFSSLSSISNSALPATTSASKAPSSTSFYFCFLRTL